MVKETVKDTEDTQELKFRTRLALLLGIAYGATKGGMSAEWNWTLAEVCGVLAALIADNYDFGH